MWYKAFGWEENPFSVVPREVCSKGSMVASQKRLEKKGGRPL